MPGVIPWAANAIAAAILSVGPTAATHATVTSAVAASATAVAVTSTAIQIAAYAAIAVATTPKVAGVEGRPTEWTADPDAAIPFVSGLRGIAGQIVHRDTFGPNNRYQGIVTVYSGGGPVNAYSTFYVDSVAKTFTGEIMDGTPANALYRQTKLGAQPDTVLTSPTVTGSYTLTGWGASHKLSGFACSMITLFQDGDLKRWPTGEPKVIQLVQGMLAWDPRQDGTWPGGVGACRLATPSTWVYSTNPIIHALKWCLGIKHNGVMVGGIGSSVDGIDVTAFIDAANIADTNTWTVSAVAYSLDDKYQTLQAYLQAGGAVAARRAGKISCVSRGAAPSSLVTISTADTAGPFELNAGAPREGRINTIIPRCVSADHDWEMVPLSPVSNSTYVTEDSGATRSRGVDYPFVSAVNQAAQLARYDIADSREGLTGTIPLKPYMRDLDPGDCFTITEDGFALSGQKFLVLSRSYDPKSDVVNVTVRSETNAKHAWALAGTGTAPATPSLGGTNPETVTTPAGADWAVAASGGTIPGVVLTGAVPSTAGVAKVFVEYKKNADSTWIPVGEFTPDTVRVEVPGLTANTSYDVGVTYRNLQGALGARLTESATTTGYVAGAGVATGTIDTTQLADDAVETVKVLNDAVTIQDTQAHTNGWGNSGAITVAYDAAMNVYTQVDEYTFSYAGTGDVTIEWIGLLQWQANAARQVRMFLCLDETPAYTAGNDTTYQVMSIYNGNQNALTATVALAKTFTGLSTGSHTIKIYGKAMLTGASQPNIDVAPFTKMMVGKK